mgnify:FL=1
MEEEGIPQRVQVTGKRFEKNLHKLAGLELVGEVRGSHFMMGIEFVKDKDTKTPFEPEDKIGLKIARAAQRRGLIVRPLGNIAILSPTLIMDEDMIDDVAAIMSDAIKEVQSEL